MNKNEPYILEFYQVGNSIKVTAIDPKSGIEATIVGSLKATKNDLTKLAVSKLEYVLNKNSE